MILFHEIIRDTEYICKQNFTEKSKNDVYFLIT